MSGGRGGSASRRSRFILEDNDLEIDATTTRLASITIVPLGSLTLSWVEAEMPAPTRMRSAWSTAGSLLVTSGLRDMPSFWAPSPATTAVVGAVGGGWRPSGNPNAIRGGNGKLKATVLICIVLAW
jgi:hypothetical protein